MSLRRSGPGSDRADAGRRARCRGDDDRGIALVMTSLMLVVLVGFAGFAVDVGNWYLTAGRAQRAADSAALGGAVFMPGDFTTADDIARDLAQGMGYSPSEVSVAPGTRPNQIRVTIRRTVTNSFASLLGVPSTTIRRSAVAEYEGPVPMGSPDGRIGDDPAQGLSDDLWINVAGPNATKISGDRYAAKMCPTTVSNCRSTTDPAVQNDDYSRDGYFFTVRVEDTDSKPLRIEAYDAVFSFQGDTCGSNQLNTTQRATLTAIGGVWADSNTRYASGNTIWCTGDQNINGTNTDTIFIVRAPDDTPWRNDDNPVVPGCTRFLTGVNPANGTEVFQRLNPADANYPADGVIDPNDGVLTYAETMRRWAPLCIIPSAQVVQGDYVLQIRTNARSASPLVYDATVANGGHNRMSLRAGFGNEGDVPDDNDVSMFGAGRLPVYANADAATTQFYLARITPAVSSRTLRVVLYDMGDASSPGTLQILPPPDSNLGGVFPTCTFRRDVPNGTPVVSSPANCTLTNVSSGTGYNGVTVQVDVTIPNTYTCNYNDGGGCWVRVRAAFPSGTTDTTTWSANIIGDPVRLVE